MATAVTPPGKQVDLSEPRSWRSAKSKIATVLMVIAFVVVIVPLGFVLYTVVSRGLPAISGRFLTGEIPFNVAPVTFGGIWPAIAGTLLITALATVIAVPIGILAAIYINEYGGNHLVTRIIRFMADVMTGVPSIIMGLFIFSIWVIHFGFSGLAGAFALACLMLPVIIRSSEEMLKLVPDPLREASYALGASKARVTLTVVLPAALSGIVSGSLLAVARAAGETAPLLFTILGGLTSSPANLNLFSGANIALPMLIFQNASSPYTGAQGRAWGAALTLIVIALIMLVVARLVTGRVTARSSQ